MTNQYTKFQPDTMTLDGEIKYASSQGGWFSAKFLKNFDSEKLKKFIYINCAVKILVDSF